jgi:ribonuclease J
MACLELDDRILIIDVGLSFPNGDMLGIDLVLPNFDYIRDNVDRVDGVVLTHGHEDHIGALPYLLRELRDIPVYGTAFTLALLRGKLEEHQVLDRCELRTVVPG